MTLPFFLLVALVLPAGGTSGSHPNDFPISRQGHAAPSEGLPYMFLFRHLAAVREEDARSGRDGEQPLLSRLREDIGLSVEAFAALVRITDECEEEVGGYDLEASGVIQRALPSYQSAPAAATPESTVRRELRSLRRRRDGAVLAARDRLRETLGPRDFAIFEAFVRREVAPKIAPAGTDYQGMSPPTADRPNPILTRWRGHGYSEILFDDVHGIMVGFAYTRADYEALLGSPVTRVKATLTDGAGHKLAETEVREDGVQAEARLRVEAYADTEYSISSLHAVRISTLPKGIVADSPRNVEKSTGPDVEGLLKDVLGEVGEDEEGRRWHFERSFCTCPGLVNHQRSYAYGVWKPRGQDPGAEVSIYIAEAEEAEEAVAWVRRMAASCGKGCEYALGDAGFLRKDQKVATLGFSLRRYAIEVSGSATEVERFARLVRKAAGG